MRLSTKLIVFISGMLIVGCSQKPSIHQQKTMGPDVPIFYYDTFTSPTVTRDSVKLEILLKVPFDAIQFLKSGNEYIGKYEISISVLDKEENVKVSRIWNQELRTESFNETNSSEHYDVSKLDYKLLPGDYTLNIGIVDLDTKKSNYQKKKIKLDNYYENQIVISDLNIIEQLIEDSTGKIESLPSVKNTMTEIEPEFRLMFNVLSDGGSGEIKYEIYSMEPVKLAEKSLTYEFTPGMSKIELKVSKEGLDFEQYNLKVFVTIGDESNSETKLFRIRWMGMSDYISNLDDAIIQLRYLASNKEIKQINQAGEDNRKDTFLEFWEKRDPTPGTPENELMDEYYRRIHYANMNFGGYQEGWMTDRGMVLVLFGEPEDVERHPFEINTKPYEIWYYHSISRSFIFVDQTGFGDYRLTTPLYDNIGYY